jgi:D-glycero-D-manno-heptose 1,7-bisphosphate phosphatase
MDDQQGGRPALFVDRDGTIIVDRHYLSDPTGVELLPGAVAGLRAFQDAGYALVVITNQSGIARGMYTAADYERVRNRLDELLAEEGVRLDGVYYCPHHPSRGDACECRKPGTLLYRCAARDLGLDFASSVYVGDRRSDVEAAATLGGRAFLVLSGYGRDQAEGYEGEVAPDLQAVARRVLALDTSDGRK